MPLPAWITNRVTAEAAVATAHARQTATNLHDQGLDHLYDPSWRAAVEAARLASEKAEEIGISPQTILTASKAS